LSGLKEVKVVRKSKNRLGVLGGAAIIPLVAAILLTGIPEQSGAEVRTYLDISKKIASTGAWGFGKKLDLFFRQENRFRESRTVFTKDFFGVREQMLSWLSTQIYYAHKELNYTRRLSKHMLVAELILQMRIGYFRIKNRNGFEWHISDGFDRYRNYSEITCFTPVKGLSLWVAEEFRFDSDQKRINVNDVRIGLRAKLMRSLSLQLFWDVEEKRRGRPSWQRNPFLGFSLSFQV